MHTEQIRRAGSVGPRWKLSLKHIPNRFTVAAFGIQAENDHARDSGTGPQATIGHVRISLETEGAKMKSKFRLTDVQIHTVRR